MKVGIFSGTNIFNSCFYIIFRILLAVPAYYFHIEILMQTNIAIISLTYLFIKPLRRRNYRLVTCSTSLISMKMKGET